MTSDQWAATHRNDLAWVAALVGDWHAPGSPLYQLFTARIAQDPDMLRLVADIENVPPLNLLFGGVQLLLTPADALAAWYPRYGGHAEPSDQAYEAFRSFALERCDELVRIGSTRRTQTNEVGRAAVLLPFIVEQLTGIDEPVHGVDVGASAGLNLCLDRFAYDYSGVRVGSSALTLACENRGGFPVPDAVPTFASRTGLDLDPVDPADPDAVAWLEALVWPEHNGRLERLRAAIDIRQHTPVTMVAGDAVQTLPAVEANLGEGALLLWHTVALYQMTAQQNADFDEVVAEIASRRPVIRISYELPATSSYPEVRIGLRPGREASIAVGHPHGAWIDRP